MHLFIQTGSWLILVYCSTLHFTQYFILLNLLLPTSFNIAQLLTQIFNIHYFMF